VNSSRDGEMKKGPMVVGPLFVMTLDQQ